MLRRRRSSSNNNAGGQPAAVGIPNSNPNSCNASVGAALLAMLRG
jgi:hypothetical protein